MKYPRWFLKGFVSKKCLALGALGLMLGTSAHAVEVGDFDFIQEAVNKGSGAYIFDFTQDITNNKAFDKVGKNITDLTFNGNGYSWNGNEQMGMNDIALSSYNQLPSPLNYNYNVTIDGFINDGLTYDEKGRLNTGSIKASINGFQGKHENKAYNDQGWLAEYGGSLLFYTGKGQVNITNSTFYDNHATDGMHSAVNSTSGGVFKFDMDSHVNIENANFVNNTAKNFAGAIQWQESTHSNFTTEGTMNISNSLFQGNEANGSAGALHISSGYNGKTHTTISNTKFFDNSAGGYGGVIYFMDGSGGSSDTKIIQSIFDSNSANLGGAIYFDIGNKNILAIKNTIFSSNISNQAGGALFIKLEKSSFATIEDTIFANNKANGTGLNGGGAIYVEPSSFNTTQFPDAVPGVLNIYKTTFENNESNTYGGAIDVEYGSSSLFPTLNIIDSTFQNNSAKEGGGAIFSYGQNLNIIAHNDNVEFTDNYAPYGNDVFIAQKSAAYIPELNLVAATDKSITFNGGLYGDGDAYGFFDLNINKADIDYELSDGKKTATPGNGEIIFNADVENFNVNLYGGKLSIGTGSVADNRDEYLNKSNLSIKGSGTLNTANGVVGDISPVLFKIDDGIEWAFNFDVDLAGEKADFLHNVSQNTGTVDISGLVLLSDTDKEELRIQYADNNVFGHFNGEDKKTFTVATGNGAYEITAENVDNDGSYLIIKKITESDDPSNPVACVSGLNCAILNNWYAFDNTDEVEHSVPFWYDESGAPDGHKNYLEEDIIIHGNGKGIVAGKDDLEGIRTRDKKLTIMDTPYFSGFTNATIVEDGGVLDVINSNFKNNRESAISVQEGGTVNLYGDMTFEDNDTAIKAEGGEVNVKGGKVVFNDKVTGVKEAKFNIEGNVDFNDELEGFSVMHQSGIVNVDVANGTDYTLAGGELNLALEEHFRPDDMAFAGGQLNIINDRTGDVTMGKVILDKTTNLSVDVDMAAESMDRLLTAEVKDNGGMINVNKFNIIGESTKKKLSINFTNDDGDLKNHVTTDITRVQGPIYNWHVGYDKELGNFDFWVNDDGWRDFNPGILAGAVAAEAGYLAMLDTYDEAFRNMDMYRLRSVKSEKGYKWNRNPYDTTTYWVKARGLYEDLPLKNGPKVSNDFYGLYLGAESEMKHYENDWKGVWSVYGGSTNSYQRFEHVKAHENGGVLGLVGMGYKGDFYTGLNFSAGANKAKAKYDGAKDDFSMYSMGIASKTGYNYQLENEKYVIQPYHFMSYTYTTVDDYTTSAGARIKSKGINTIHLEPGIKFIANLEDDWQPYGGVSYVWTLGDKTKFTADGVDLPEFNIKPYVKYGGGIRKTWDDSMTGYIQAYRLDGGRRGVDIQAGVNIPF